MTERDPKTGGTWRGGFLEFSNASSPHTVRVAREPTLDAAMLDRLQRLPDLEERAQFAEYFKKSADAELGLGKLLQARPQLLANQRPPTRTWSLPLFCTQLLVLACVAWLLYASAQRGQASTPPATPPTPITALPPPEPPSSVGEGKRRVRRAYHKETYDRP